MKHCFRFMHLRLAMILLSIYGFSFLVPSCQAQEPFAAVVAKVKPSVVIVEGFFREDSVHEGTGFIITETGDVITNYHVIDSCFSAKVILINGKRMEVKGIVAKDEKADLVRLALADVDTTFVPLTTCDTAKAGDIILVVGNPMELWWSVSNGMVADPARHIPEWGGDFLQHTAPTYPGSSGSPVFNLRGEVIGIHARSIRENIHYAIPASKINDLQPQEIVTLPEERASKDTLWANSPDGHYYLGNALYSIGKYTEALPHLQEALKGGKGKNEPEIYLKVADGLKRIQQIEQAIDAYKQAISLSPDYFRAWFWLGDLYYTHERYLEAAQAYEQAKRIDPDLYGVFHNLALAYSHFSQPVEMLRLCRNAINTYGDRCELHVWVGDAYRRMGRFDEAEKAYKIAIALACDNVSSMYDSLNCAGAYWALGELYDSLGLDQEAEKCRENADTMRPIFKIIKITRAPSAIEIARKSPGFVVWTVLPKKSCSDSSTSRLHDGIAEESRGQYESALRKYKEAIDVCPAFAAGYKHLLNLCCALGRFQEALDILDDAIKTKYCFEWTYDRLAVVFSVSNPDSMTEEFLENAKYDSERRPCEIVYGVDNTYSIDGWTSPIPPDTAFKRCALGVICEHQGDTAEAMGMYNQAIQIYPNFAEAHFLLGRAYVSLGDFVSALKERKILKELNNFLADKLLDLIYPP